MNKKDRCLYILNELEVLFSEVPIPLNHQDSYTLLISVLLSAQCTDVRVNKTTPLLFQKAQTPEDMVKLSVREIEDIIRPCGLAPRKAKNIHDLSRILLDSFGGIVPNDMDALESLPGVGHKTAGVVLSQAFGVPAFPVDTHVHRLAQQWQLTSGRNVAQTEKDLKRCFPKTYWNKLHLQIVFYGREYCRAHQCDGMSCHLCRHCFPMRKEKRIYKRA